MSYDHHLVSVHWYEGEKPGWHEFRIQNHDYDAVREHIEHYQDIVEWIYNNIDGCERHARWMITAGTEISVKFRYERDLIKFVLRWA